MKNILLIILALIVMAPQLAAGALAALADL
jgi:hypothetical protein